MVHLAMTDCRRIAEFANGPACGPAQRRGIVEKLRDSLVERQSDPHIDPQEVVELHGLLAALRAAP